MGALPNGQMGTLAIEDGRLTKLYGELAVRFNALRTFTGCLIAQVNTHQAPEVCR